jgi:hypothetical protein
VRMRFHDISHDYFISSSCLQLEFIVLFAFFLNTRVFLLLLIISIAGTSIMRNILDILILASLAVIEAQNVTSLNPCGVSIPITTQFNSPLLALTAIGFRSLEDKRIST